LANAVLELMVPKSCLGLCIGYAILGLGDANDLHHLIMRPYDIPDDAFGLGVDGATSLIVHLLVAEQVCWALARNHIIVW
jgi:hypothetical protein